MQVCIDASSSSFFADVVVVVDWDGASKQDRQTDRKGTHGLVSMNEPKRKTFSQWINEWMNESLFGKREKKVFSIWMMQEDGRDRRRERLMRKLLRLRRENGHFFSHSSFPYQSLSFFRLFFSMILQNFGRKEHRIITLNSMIFL